MLALLLVISGCSSTDFRRLAPPGIIKYEQIASEKEQNPAIAAEIDAYKANTKAKFPVIGRTPAGTSNPNIPGNRNADQLGDQTGSLAERRDKLLEEVAADQNAVEADRTEVDELSSAGANLADDPAITKPAAENE